MGLLKKLFGSSYSSRAWRDQRHVGTTVKNLISPINDYGTCFKCEGTGTITLECKVCQGKGEYEGQCNYCNGTGTIQLEAKQCFACAGSGKHNGQTCLRCSGTGNFKPAVSRPCHKCQGSGRFSASCRKCEGKGSFSVTCRKCNGSGWHKF